MIKVLLHASDPSQTTAIDMMDMVNQGPRPPATLTAADNTPHQVASSLGATDYKRNWSESKSKTSKRDFLVTSSIAGTINTPGGKRKRKED
ncbi:hypothetical protein T265_00687 [Opisthorchis viverrini]|uniref:Uncharacterized protein n=1 Tax=Opisthorchis viverrini TaxID=6198 RepID=A0A075A1X1_OPIVI|nr:hypothetical protein T265_00687 [Opisthorchis viverrini]KER33366.1 hypothetical protein T265_00687 [Opisthorchis viverrini]